MIHTEPRIHFSLWCSCGINATGLLVHSEKTFSCKAKIDSLWCWGNCSIYVGMQFRVIYSCTYLFTQHKILAWFHEVSGKVPVQSHPGRRGCAACVRAYVRSPVFEKQSNVYRKSSKRPLSWQHAKKMGQLKSEQRSSLDSPLSAYFGAEFDARVGPPI